GRKSQSRQCPADTRSLVQYRSGASAGADGSGRLWQWWKERADRPGLQPVGPPAAEGLPHPGEAPPPIPPGIVQYFQPSFVHRYRYDGAVRCCWEAGADVRCGDRSRSRPCAGVRTQADLVEAGSILLASAVFVPDHVIALKTGDQQIRVAVFIHVD